ncbi:S-methyl-5-thioribose-1-phosphate isomerase [Thermomicrobiaceae bacterium CFH 74404]|uniref:Methylthioribose-1-phosphate isomerase n=1 Tax=Thermalbibacter longus TaxID=2951981 RepID=A0AA41WFB1_9BACT|nr:S-methyl-5-thioribose-1-phosphate isomerase [Thermalbibacter longus]MCM8750023.1 S-methyl-5-thioribose-1-phosphate isomerase [Thermalbibacter longus]
MTEWFESIKWDGEALVLLDQTRLPHEECWVRCATVDEVAGAISEMKVRGAPAIGLAAAAGMALAAKEAVRSGRELEAALEQACATLARTRPTAVNLFWALDRARETARSAPSAEEAVVRLSRLVDVLLEEQRESDRAIGDYGAALLPDGARVLTHCNTGALATGAYGTALGVVRRAHELGKLALVYVDESRPRLQGARLTAWELLRAGVPFRLVVDAAAASLIARGLVDAVIVGADRIAANGDVANKIGTLGLAVAARHFGVPFYVAAPLSTFDPGTPDGASIRIEERNAEEVLLVGQERVAPEGTVVLNPAFDVTPAELVTAIITDVGVVASPVKEHIDALLGELARREGGRLGAVQGAGILPR